MIDKLEYIVESHRKLNEQLADPKIMSDLDNYKKLTKKVKELDPIIAKFHDYKKIIDGIQGNKEILKDPSVDAELKEMAQMELEEYEQKVPIFEEDLRLLLVPKDPNDEKNAIVEIRAGTGGDEAALFAGELYRMYCKYCDIQDWKHELMSFTESEKGGFKEIIMMVTGYSSYGTFKYESGVHRVQRVPETETQGRVHTSAATVATLLESEDINIDLAENDIRIDVYRSSGNGGQSVNTTDSAVRVTHLPTGMIVTCQDEKSQLKNKIKATKILKARLYDIEMQKQQASLKNERLSMVGTGDRSAKIRTYNFPQSRCTDHRINLTSYNLDRVMNGEISEFIEQLKLADRSAKLGNIEV
jgi:peptide chain release factor 1